MGRNERNVPDYVLGVDPTKGEESAVVLIEPNMTWPRQKIARKLLFRLGLTHCVCRPSF
ncbi:hypothetical protein JCM31598_28150 [Desulfonatronum parangueonense]